MTHRSSPTPHPARDRLALAVTLLAGLLLFAAFRDHGYDDSHITFRYAQNLAAGAGFVYNPGERLLSTTAPGLALALAPVVALGWDVPLVANLLSCLAFALGGLAIYQLGRAWSAPAAGAAGGLLYASFPLFYRAVGGEAGLLQALLLWGFVAVARGRAGLGGLLLGLAALVRADAAVGALAAGLYVLAAAWRGLPPGGRGPRALLAALPWGAALAYVAVVLPWLLFCWAYFGQPLPLTLEAKRRQAAVPGTELFAPALLDYLRAFWGYGPLRLPLLLAPLGLLAALRDPRWLLPIGWGLLHALAYSLLGVPGYFWYFLPPLGALMVAAGLAVGQIAAVIRPQRPRLAAGGGALLLAAALGGQVVALADIQDQPDRRLGPYRAAGEWLAANAGPAESVGALEIGVIGYYGGRPMVDFAGLIQPEVGLSLGPAGYVGAGRYALDRYRPDLIVLQESLLSLAEGAGCALAAEIPDPGAPPLRIFRCGGELSAP